MVCLADPAVRNRARRDIKDMIEKRLTYRKETLLRDEVPPIPNVRRTPKELSLSPVYKRTKSMIPRRINKILVNKSRQVFNETSTSLESPEKTVTINTTYLDSDHDFGYYNRTKRKKSTTIQDLTLQLKETRRLLDVLKEAEEVPEVGDTPRDKPVRRKIEMGSGRRRPIPKIADFVSAKELDCESIGSDSELELSPESPGRVDKFGVKSSYQDENLSEFEKMERSVSKRRHSGGSTVLNESDPFTDSDYMEVGVNLQEELDISKEYESDAFSMCSEKISHMDARKMLSESEKRFSAILDSLDQEDPDDSFVENERLMQQHSSKLDDILSIPSSVEDLRFDKEELPLLTRSNSDTGSTVTDKKPADIMVPVRQNLHDRPALKFSKQAQSDDQGRVLQPTPIKPIAKKPVPAVKAKENIDFKNYESDLNEIENLLFKYDEYRLEQEQKKSEKKTELEEEKLEQPVITKAKTVGTKKVVKDGQTKKISDGIVSKPKVAPQPISAVVSASTNSAKSQSGIKTGIAKGTTKTAIKKPLIAPKPASSSKVGAKLSPTKTTLTKSPAKEAAPKGPESSAIAITKGSRLKTDTEKSAVKEKPSPSSSVIPSKLSPPKKVGTTSKTEEKDSSGQKPTKISPSKIAMKTKTTSPAKIVEKPSSMSSTAPVKKSNTSSLTKGVLKPPSESETKASSSTPLKASPSKKLTKLTPSSSLGKSKGNYVKSAMMATTKSSTNNSNDNIDKDSSAAANKGLSPLRKTSAITTKTGVKSSPTKETSDSKISSPKSKLSSVKPSALVKSTIPKPSSSVTIKSTKQSVTPQKPKSIAEEKPHSTPKPAVSMKPAKSDLPSIKPSIASKLAASATSSSKAKPVSKATGLAKPSVNKAATTLTSTHSDSKDVKTSPEKSPSKILPKKQTLIQKTTASAKASENTTEAKAPRSKESAAIKTVSKPVSKLAPPKATSTPIKSAKSTAKSNLSPEKSHSNATSNESSAKPTASSTKSSKAPNESPSKSSKAASESPLKSSKAARESPSKSSKAASESPSKSSTATSKYPSKSGTAPSEPNSKSSSAAIKSDSKSSTTKSATPSKSTIVSPSKSNTAINKSQTKSILSSPKPVKKSTGAPTTTTAAKKPKTTQPAVVKEPEGEPKQESTTLKASEKSPLKVKSPAKATSKIPSQSKSSAPGPTIKSVNKSETPKSSSGLNPKTDLTKPKVSPKPKVKTLTRTSSTKTIPKPKPVLRF